MKREYVVTSQGASYARGPMERFRTEDMTQAVDIALMARETVSPSSRVSVLRIDDKRVTAVLSFYGAKTRSEAMKLARLVNRYEGWRFIDPANTARGACLESDPWPNPEADTRRPTPVVGEPYAITPEYVVIPTYVVESETPTREGACFSQEYLDRPITATGWYVEYHTPEQRAGVGQYRQFIPFELESEER